MIKKILVLAVITLLFQLNAQASDKKYLGLMTIDPEKDVLLIVCHKDVKNKIMEAILEKEGINTDARGMCISLPIDNMVGIVE